MTQTTKVATSFFTNVSLAWLGYAFLVSVLLWVMLISLVMRIVT